MTGMGWFVYVLVSASGSRTYVGITIDLERRLQEHNGELPRGAKATRRGRPWSIGASFGPFETKSEALKLELRIKKLRGLRRLAFRP
jgi:predicted GIY-YIG superfamily endonuclease